MSIIQKIILNRARVISFFAWFLVATSAVLAFWGLGDQSLWLDEIFTFYFSGQDLGDPNAILERSLEGIHPPFYYLIIHYWSTLWSTLGIQFATSARLFSAIMAVLSLVLLNRILSKRVSHSARAVTLALAATSGIWVYYAQEARSYSLAHVIVLIIAALAIRQGGKLSTPQPVPALVGNLFLLAVVSAVGSLVHLYLILVAGGFFAGLLWLARDVRSKIVIATFGVTVALASFMVLVWIQSSTVLSSSENWIKTDLSFLANHFKNLLRRWMLPTSHGIVILLIVVLEWRMLRNIRPKHSDASILFFLAIVALGFSLASAILLSLFKLPVFTNKLAFITAPVLWIALAVPVDRILRNESRRLAGLVLTSFLAISMILTHKPFIPLKQDWRASASFVESLDHCSDISIPVVVHGAQVVRKNAAELFYGHYASRPMIFEEFPRAALKENPVNAAILDRAAKIVSGQIKCPLLLWSVHNLGKGDIISIQRAILAELPVSFFPKRWEFSGYDLAPSLSLSDFASFNSNRTFVITLERF